MRVTPNFNFAGQCEEALDLYQRAFGAKVNCLLRYADAQPGDDPVQRTPEQLRWVYYAEMMLGETRVMMGDNPDVPYQPGLSNFLTLTFDTKQQVLTAYEALKEGATILTPVRSTTYSSCEVVLVDRFGVRWGLMTEQTER